MKLKDTYITHDSDGEQILLDTSSSFAGLIRNNKTTSFTLVDERKKIWYDKEKMELDFYERRKEDAKEHEEI